MSSPLHSHRLVPCAVMERLCFLFADPIEKEALPGEPPQDFVEVTMEFSGPLRGTLRMALPDELCVEVAANALGVGPDEEARTKAWDATGELLNVICGQVLVAMCGSVPVFDLTPPRARRGETKDWAAVVAGEDSVAYQIDRWPLILSMTVEEEEGTGD